MNTPFSPTGPTTDRFERRRQPTIGGAVGALRGSGRWAMLPGDFFRPDEEQTGVGWPWPGGVSVRQGSGRSRSAAFFQFAAIVAPAGGTSSERADAPKRPSRKRLRWYDLLTKLGLASGSLSVLTGAEVIVMTAAKGGSTTLEYGMRRRSAASEKAGQAG